VLGRVVWDSVTTLGSGVDGSVRLIVTSYDAQGNADRITSYDGTGGGNIVHELYRTFNGLGQLIAEYQQRGAGVNPAVAPKVQYAWSEMPSGANHSRLTSVTYEDGYVLTYNYASGLNSNISRLTSLSDSGGTLESYEYLGLGTVVVRAHPQPNVDLSYVKRTGESVGDAGDQYTGLDRFGRVVDQRWLDPTSGTATDRFQYGYDLMGNRLYRDNLVNAAFGELYAYDGMDQLSSFDRGTLNGPKTGLTGAASRSQDWDYDAVGNFDSVTTNGGSPQTRTANAQNEITAISGATTPTYDANGNMTGDETGKQFVYDAWNRLVIVKNSGGTTLKTYGYDGLNRRVSETAGGVTTDLFYSASWQVLTEKVASNTTKRYVWSPVYVDAMVLRDRDTNADGSLDERLWVQQDANWNVTALVNGSGVVVERYAYDPYGAQSVYNASWSSIGSSAYSWVHGYQGRPFDSTSGTNNFRNREVSPTLGRPIQVDMLRFAAGDVNFYRWEENSPNNRVDPSGLQPPFPSRKEPIGGWKPDPTAAGTGGTAPGPRPVLGSITGGPAKNPVRIEDLFPPKPRPAFPDKPGVVTESITNETLNDLGKLVSTAQGVTSGKGREAWIITEKQAPWLRDVECKPTILSREQVIKLGKGTNINSGFHAFFRVPTDPNQFFGTGGCGPCVGLIIVSNDGGGAIFHFASGVDYVYKTVNQYDWYSEKGRTCKAYVFGGEKDKPMSNDTFAGAFLWSQIMFGDSNTFIVNDTNLLIGKDGVPYVRPQPPK
jgi:RHS repeat-associated protein